MSSSANAVTVVFFFVLCFLSAVESDAFSQDCPVSRSIEITESLILYDAAPEPWWFFPLVLSTVKEIGMVGSGQRLRICEVVQRSSWRQRSLWVRIDGNAGEGEDEGQRTGQGLAGWINAGPIDLDSFLTRQRARP